MLKIVIVAIGIYAPPVARPTTRGIARKGRKLLARVGLEEALPQVGEGSALDGLDDDNVIHHWSATGRDVEFRNTGLIGGTWCGSRHDEDQLWTNRPIPELARYRSPIEGLYHAHQTSGHPGGLCLMAIPYNLMHILIEDGIAQPGDWWYASPWYIPQDGKVPANRS